MMHCYVLHRLQRRLHHVEHTNSLRRLVRHGVYHMYSLICRACDWPWCCTAGARACWRCDAVTAKPCRFRLIQAMARASSRYLSTVSLGVTTAASCGRPGASISSRDFPAQKCCDSSAAGSAGNGVWVDSTTATQQQMFDSSPSLRYWSVFSKVFLPVSTSYCRRIFV